MNNERPDGVRGTLDRLTDPDRVAARVSESRRHGVGALLPPLSEAAEEMLGEVPEGYQPGGVIRSERSLLAAAIEEGLALAQAIERVREYVRVEQGHREKIDRYGDPVWDPIHSGPADIIDTTYPPGGAGIDGIDLLLSDLRLLVGLTDFEE